MDDTTTSLSTNDMIGLGMGAFGVGTRAYGQYTQGQAYLEHGMVENAAAQYAAQQLRINAGQVQAASQYSAQEIGRQAQYITSTQVARAAASGGGVDNPTVLNLMARTQSIAAFKQATAMYSGEAQSRMMQIEAASKEWSGQEALRVAQRTSGSANFASLSTLLTGGTSLLQKYGRNGPPGSVDPGEMIG